MIKVSVLYPGGEEIKFDMAYYCEKHIPLVKDCLGTAAPVRVFTNLNPVKNWFLKSP